MIVTCQLLEKYDPANHPERHQGISRFLTSQNTAFARAGDNAFLLSTPLTPEEVVDSIRPHLVRGEFVCAFTVTPPAHYVVPHFIQDQINRVLRDTEFEDTIPPTTVD